MRGRLRLEELNDFVSAFNLTIQEKYKLINSYSVHSSTEELYKRYQIYKSQENPETKGMFLNTLRLKTQFSLIFVIMMNRCLFLHGEWH